MIGNNFIEVTNRAPGTDFHGKKVLINLKWVEEIQEYLEDHAVIYMAFMTPNSSEQDYIYTVESYEEIKRMLWR